MSIRSLTNNAADAAIATSFAGGAMALSMMSGCPTHRSLILKYLMHIFATTDCLVSMTVNSLRFATFEVVANSF